MVSDLEENYNRYDAFIIMHGTDTMAYTASALSFMIENLKKPIILTGSQVPFAQEPNDATHNLLMSLTLAGHFDIPEVCIYFDHKLLRGNRTKKIDALGFSAFNSANIPALVKVGIEVEVDWNLLQAPPLKDEETKFHKTYNPNVCLLKLFPGISDSFIHNFLQPPLEACVIETYGSGNAPNNRPEFLNLLSQAIKRGIIILNVTQCLKGSVNQGSYATGSALAKIGVISGHDMTTEAALSKLSYLLSRTDLTSIQIKELLETNLRGELTYNFVQKYSFGNENFLSAVSKAIIGSSVPSDEIKNALFPILMCSSSQIGLVDNIKSLIKSGANPNYPDYEKRYPLHIAASEGHLNIVKILIESGADINVKDKWGETALDNAIKFDHTDVSNYLKSFGEK